MHPIIIGLIGVIFILFLVIIQIFIYRPTKIYLNLLLSTSIFGIIWYVVIYVLISSKYICYYPALFNKGLPFYYLIAPCMYLFIKGSLNKEYSLFKKRHLFHLLPVIPAIFEIIPYSLAPAKVQLAVVNHVVKDIKYAFTDNVYIINPIHWFIFPISACFYCLLQFLVIRKATKKRKKSKLITIWLYILTLTMSLLFTCMIILNGLVYHQTKSTGRFLINSKWVIVMYLCILIISFLFFINQEFIYGFKRRISNELDESKVNYLEVEKVNDLGSTNANIADDEYKLLKVSAQVKDKERYFEPKKEIGNHFKFSDKAVIERVTLLINREETYRRSGLTLSEFASISEIPNHKLTQLFNSHFKVGFKNYVNQLRVEYVIKRLDQGDSKQFTLESIAKDAGFLTRNTFFLAFKKHVGMKPSDYINQIRE